MAKKSAISDDALARALGVYAGMVERVLNDPGRWLGADGELPATAGLPRRVLGGLRRQTLGKTNPTSPTWSAQPVTKRVSWWVARIGFSAGLAAAAPRFAGVLADRLPLQAALGASAAGLAVCATAREHGVTAAGDWVPLLARVIVDRELPPRADAVPTATESEQALDTPADVAEGPVLDGGQGRVGGGPSADAPGPAAVLGRAAQTLWRLARTFLELPHLLDERPRGGFLARTVGKFPVVGVAGGWLDERGGINKAARETTALLS